MQQCVIFLSAETSAGLSFFQIPRKTNKMTIGKRIKELRGKMTQAEFGPKNGVSRNTVTRYELGEVPPNSIFLETLCKKYSVQPNWLLLGKGPKHWGEEQEQQPKPTSNGKVLVSNFEDPFITDIKLFVNEMAGKDPSWRHWFKMELIRKIDVFREWWEPRQPKKGEDDINQSNVA